MIIIGPVKQLFKSIRFFYQMKIKTEDYEEDTRSETVLIIRLKKK